MTTIEETGRNVEEATEKALEQLGVTEDQVDVEILEEGSKGFLGIGQALARVRVTVREMPAGEAKPRPASTRPAQGRRKPAPKREARPPRQEVKPPKQDVKPPKPKAKPAPKEKAEPEQMATGEALQQAAEVGREVLARILEGIESPGEVVVRTASDSQVVLDVVGGDTARIIGRHGQTIDSIQYLVGIIVNRKIGARARVLVDAEGYRERREETLRKQALTLAKKVKETGQEAVLESLHSNERRVIHTALVDNPDVYTYSEGEEPNRFLVISPKK